MGIRGDDAEAAFGRMVRRVFNRGEKRAPVEIGNEIFAVWRTNPNCFYIHPTGSPPPRTQAEFRKMFQAEINDANTASVVSGGLGIPICRLAAGTKILAGRKVAVNQSQVDKQAPNMKRLVQTIE